MKILCGNSESRPSRLQVLSQGICDANPPTSRGFQIVTNNSPYGNLNVALSMEFQIED